MKERMKAAPRKSVRLKCRAPQGITAALAANVAAQRWTHRQLRSTRTLASISAELNTRFGIQASIRALSSYLHRHANEIFGVKPAPVCEGRWLLTVRATGATHLEAKVEPLPTAPTGSVRKAVRR